MLMMGNISLGLTLCILALLCTSVSPTPLEKDPEAPQFDPRAFVTVTADVPVVTAVKQINAPWYNTACKSVSLFYWETASPDTACLSTLADPPIVTPPAGLTMQSPSVYVIFTSFYLYDGCGTKLLEADFDVTTSYAPDQVSTVATGPNGALTTEAFDFADLPCPPPGVHVQAGQPYRPLLAPPAFITDIPGWNPHFDNCDPGHGIDPPTAMTSVFGGLPAPVAGFGGGPHPRRDAGVSRALPVVVPRAPTRTAAPAA
ncbi:hypothetical protein BDR22DRAFT_821385 [Usnea florida]